MIDARNMPKVVLSENDAIFSTGGIIAGLYLNITGNPHGKMSLLVNATPEKLQEGVDNYRTEVHSGGLVVENGMKKIYSARPNLAIENNDAFAQSLSGNILSSAVFLSGTTHFGEIISAGSNISYHEFGLVSYDWVARTKNPDNIFFDISGIREHLNTPSLQLLFTPKEISEGYSSIMLPKVTIFYKN